MTNTGIKSITPVDQVKYDLAITKGLEIIKSGGSKADAARAIFDMIRDESREVVIKAFVEGATVTEKGSPTYFYNINRQFKKIQNRELKTSPKVATKASKPKEC